jgi:hypothetical protein
METLLSPKMFYFTINVVNGNDEHVGTISTNGKMSKEFVNQELAEKLKISCKEHFSSEKVEIKTAFDIEDFLYGRYLEIKLQLTDEDGEVTEDTVGMSETWLI